MGAPKRWADTQVRPDNLVLFNKKMVSDRSINQGRPGDLEPGAGHLRLSSHQIKPPTPEI
jgi:hypothetical protein